MCVYVCESVSVCVGVCMSVCVCVWVLVFVHVCVCLSVMSAVSHFKVGQISRAHSELFGHFIFGYLVTVSSQ